VEAVAVKWYPFDKSKGSRQKRPPLGRYVLVQLPAKPEVGLPPAVAVGFRKDAAGDKQSPYFVIPGIGGEPSYWSDCLPEDFGAPLWGGQTR
jgi:hypothetical protein